jgi:alpha-methylacyl-CoA racemase
MVNLSCALEPAESLPALKPPSSPALRFFTNFLLLTFNGGVDFFPNSDSGVPLTSLIGAHQGQAKSPRQLRQRSFERSGSCGSRISATEGRWRVKWDRYRGEMTEEQSGRGPLAGIKVLELAGIGPAPFACMMLADLGADVMRLERPGGGASAILGRFDVLARGRRSVAIDLKAPGATALAIDLVRQADVLIEAFRPGVAERLGVGPNVCLAANPRLIYARMTGWGQQGPLAARVGHDIDYAAIAGAISAIGEPGRKPVPPLNLVADFGGGAMFCVTGVLCALIERITSGQGQVIDVAMVDGVSSLLAMAHSQQSAGLMNDERGSNLLDGGAPYYDTYRCSDGEYMAAGAIEPQFFAELVRVLDLPDSPKQGDTEAWPRMRELFTRAFASRTRAEWIDAFEGVDACVAPVWRLSEAAADPHLKARGTLVTIDGVVHPAVAPRFSRTPGVVGAPARPVGSDTVEALRAWGVEEPAIGQLLDDGTIVQV